MPSPTASRSPGQRAGLDRAQVLAAARFVLGASGADGLSMRSVARRLGVSPNALYSHVTDKSALIDEVLDDLLDDVDAPDPAAAADPLGAIHRLMSSTYGVLCAHPDLVPQYLARQGSRGPNAVRLGEIMDALFARLGVVDDAAEARRALIVYTIGSAAFSPPPGATGAVLDATRMRTNFEAGLNWMLRGIAGA